MAVRRYAFSQWDVFASERLSGNPLAIFSDADGLATAQMQRLARETNLSETAFVFRRPGELESARGVRVRIFTPEKELPFAGHPSLGVAMMLATAGHPSPVVLDLDGGRVGVEVDAPARFGEMRQMPARFLSRRGSEEIAPHLGLDAREIAADVPCEVVWTGLAYLIVPVRSLDAARRILVDWRTATPFLASLPEEPSLYVVTRETVDSGARLHARCLDPEREDPATGSAAGCAAAWMVANGIADAGERVVIEQGLEIGRPSRLFVRAARDGSGIGDVRVGGHAVEVLRGEYLVDVRDDHA